MVNLPTSDSLTPIDTYDFLPSVNRWVAAGSWFIVLVLGGAVTAAFFVTYRTTVKAPVVVRPAGEPRLVQSAIAGTIVSINATENAAVSQGEVIARLDTSSLEVRAAQLLLAVDRGEDRLAQIDAQLVAADRQLAAEVAQAQRAIAAASADYSALSRANQNESIAAVAAVREARTQIDLLTREVRSFQLLASSGAVSQLQLYEKQASLEAAKARMVSLQAALNPSAGNVIAAQQRIAQTQASGAATVAQLQKAKQQLAQQRLEAQEQLETTQQEIAQVNLELQNALVRSPISGTLHEISLRNTGQVVSPAETLAKVIPANAAVVIRARVPTEQINKVDIGLPAQVKISACPFSKFGTVAGRVIEISPDVVTPDAQSSQAAAYSLVIAAEQPFLAAADGEICRLLPGIEGEATIISRTETMISFLLRKASLAVR